MKTKKYFVTGLLVAVMTIVTAGFVPTTEAYGGNANLVRNQNQQQINIQNISPEHRQELIGLLTELVLRLQQMTTLVEGRDDNSEIVVMTRSATDVSDDDALLRGRVADFNRSDYAYVWFEYGTDSRDLNKKTNSERIEEDEDGDFSHRVMNLRDDTTYYFRATGVDNEGIDEGVRDYGGIVGFRTDDSFTAEDHPDVTTQSAIDVRDHQADLRGYVDMNDFNNGEVFFVYGEDEDQIEDVGDDFDTYSDVDEDGEDLQKVRVDTDLDSSDSYREEVDGLDENTRHHFSICIGYEDEDDDDVITCGSVRSFTTD